MAPIRGDIPPESIMAELNTDVKRLGMTTDQAYKYEAEY